MNYKSQQKLDDYLQKEREALDREITFFHFGKAMRKINKCIALAKGSGAFLGTGTVPVPRILKLVKKINNLFFFYYFSSQAYILNKNFKQAIHFLNQALILNPADGCCYNDKALCFAELGKYDLALKNFNIGITREPDCASLHQNKGWLLHLIGKYKEALFCFHKALEVDPKRIEAIFSLADTYQKLGDSAKAKKYFLKVKPLLKNKCSLVYKETIQRLKNLTQKY